MAGEPPALDTAVMIRRLVALTLWAYFSWYLAALLAAAVAAPVIAGPIAVLLTIVLGATGWYRSRQGSRPSSRGAELRPTVR